MVFSIEAVDQHQVHPLQLGVNVTTPRDVVAGGEGARLLASRAASLWTPFGPSPIRSLSHTLLHDVLMPQADSHHMPLHKLTAGLEVTAVKDLKDLLNQVKS